VPALLFAAFVLLATVAIAGQRPQDYTQWRGQPRDGSASALVIPKTWPERFIRHWKVAVGEGYATPLIVRDVVYVFTRIDGEEGITALDARTGRQRWRSSYRAPYTPSQPSVAHGAGPKATPLFHEGRLFTVGISGIVTAFNATNGARIWQTSAPAEMPFYSAASSPVGDAGIVIAHPGNYGPLTAYDASTGAVKWTAGDGGFFASPIIVTLNGVRQVVTMTQSAVIGVSPHDGAMLWTFPYPGGNGGPTPVVDDSTIIVSGSAEGTTGFTVAQRDGKWLAEKTWQTKDVALYISTPVVVDHTMYGMSTRSSGQYFALDTRTGQTLWLGPPRQAANAALVKAGGLVLYLNDSAELIVTAANRARFDPVKRYTVADSATWAQPLISGKRLFIKDVDSLTLWTID